MPVEEWPKMKKLPKVLYRIYGDRIQTLRQLILQLLRTSFSNAHCECERFNYCPKCDPPGYLLRDEDHAEYWKLLECSYGVVSNPGPLPHAFTLENRWTQQQIIERAIELQFRQAARPLNVICFGYGQLQPSHAEMASTSTAYGLELTNSNSAVKILNSEAWVVLLSRVGDTFMLHLLLYMSIFYPLPNNSYVQLVGVPISSLVSSSRPHELLQIRRVCHDTTETRKNPGFQTKNSLSNLRNQYQLEDLSHKSIQLIHRAEVSSIIPVTRCTGPDLKFLDFIRNRPSKCGDTSYRNVRKRPFTSDLGRSKKKKVNTDESPLTPKKFFHNSSTYQRSEDYYKKGHSSKAAVPAFRHVFHEFAGMNNLHICSEGHPKMGPVELPESYCCLSKRSPVHLGSHSKSKSVEHQFVYLNSLAKTDSAHECLNLENTSMKVQHPLSCNIARREGRLKKRSRIFSWQRRKVYKAQERLLSTERKEQFSRLKDKTNADHMRSEQLQSPLYFANSLDNHGSLNCLGVGSQYASKKLLEGQTIRTTSGRNCIAGAFNMRIQKDDNSSEAIYDWQTQPNKNNQHIFSLDKSHVSEKLSKRLIANPANGDLNENDMLKYQCMLLCHKKKLSCSCLCWLMVHMRHMDTVNILINRRSLFYNSKFTHHGGFPPNHILNVAKPRLSGAKQLLEIGVSYQL